MAVPQNVTATRQALGAVGVWTTSLQREPAAVQREAVARIEALGYGSVWQGEVVGANDVFAQEAVWLAATSRIVAGTGIANIWARHAGTARAAAATLADAWPGRFVLGLGVSHAPIVERSGQAYSKPLQRMREYLDGMGDVPAGLPVVLAALRPRMLQLAADRAGGAHTYFVPLEHTAQARAVLGPDRLLIPEQAVVVETSPQVAREVARRHTVRYLQLPNYVNNLRRLGLTGEDLDGAGSDRLVDAIVAWGTPADIAARVRAHLDAGADHVLVQPLGDGAGDALRQLEELAPALMP
ncbi:TIGR03620 family F420-dependent LLM class oxidoreductase [Dactylosporangium sp. CA-233914]|uniref:TIGR03620 family F420-dependent LLM class oxidoreductase n=1 Tax=Dactylosporangium sp. CA-233914 TaxID=3239934 RepID=UPI003D8B0474